MLVFFKGNDSHDYKFSSAVLEDAATLSPAAQPLPGRERVLAEGSGARESSLVKRRGCAGVNVHPLRLTKVPRMISLNTDRIRATSKKNIRSNHTQRATTLNNATL